MKCLFGGNIQILSSVQQPENKSIFMMIWSEKREVDIKLWIPECRARPFDEGKEKRAAEVHYISFWLDGYFSVCLRYFIFFCVFLFLIFLCGEIWNDHFREIYIGLSPCLNLHVKRRNLFFSTQRAAQQFFKLISFQLRFIEVSHTFCPPRISFTWGFREYFNHCYIYSPLRPEQKDDFILQ